MAKSSQEFACKKHCPAIYRIHFCTYNYVVQFEWDEHKNLANHAKHKVSFELARLVFADPLHLVKFDRIVDGEERWHAMGNVMGRHVLLVAHTYRNREDVEIIRIISARRASPQERRQYEQA